MALNFWERQSFDEAGVHAVKLQKIIIFLVLVQFVNIVFSGYSLGKLLCGLVTLIVYSLAYHGALRRKTCLLRMYYVLHVVGFLIVVALSIFAVAFFFQWKAGICTGATDGSELFLNYNNNNNNDARDVHPTPFEGSDSYNNVAPAPPPNSASLPTNNYVEYCWQDGISNTTCSGQLLGTCVSGDFQMTQSEYHGPQQFNVWSILFMISQLIIFFYKICSIVLAFKLRKLLLKAKKDETHQLEENSNSIPMSEFPETTEYYPVPTEMPQYPTQFYPQTPIYMPAQSANGNMMTFSMYPQMVAQQPPAPIAPPKPQ